MRLLFYDPQSARVVRPFIADVKPELGSKKIMSVVEEVSGGLLSEMFPTIVQRYKIQVDEFLEQNRARNAYGRVYYFDTEEQGWIASSIVSCVLHDGNEWSIKYQARGPSGRKSKRRFHESGIDAIITLVGDQNLGVQKPSLYSVSSLFVTTLNLYHYVNLPHYDSDNSSAQNDFTV